VSTGRSGARSGPSRPRVGRRSPRRRGRRLGPKRDRSLHPRPARAGVPDALPGGGEGALIRRAALDLTGMPSTPEEVDAFLAEHRARCVRTARRSPAGLAPVRRADGDRLARPRAIRGHARLQMDRERPMWAWRDWVIRAFNRNQPFDEFVIWQVAGDLLPNPTREQRLATAFTASTCRTRRGDRRGGVPRLLPSSTGSTPSAPASSA